jgi:hypothetical protein
MTGLSPTVRRPVLACAAVLAIGLTAIADDAAVYVNTAPTLEGATTDLNIAGRPNTKQPFYVLVKNISKVRRTFVVELVSLDAGAAVLSKSEDIVLEENASGIAKFSPPAPPKKEEAKTPAEAKKEAAEAMKAEPPAGIPIKLAKLADDGTIGFGFKVRVSNKAPAGGLTVTVPDKLVTLTILNPSAYLEEPVVSLEGDVAKRGIRADVKSKSRIGMGRTREETFEPPVEVNFLFPPQLALKPADRRAGTYQRAITESGQLVTLRANLPAIKGTDSVRFNLTVDGFPRAYAYSLDPARPVRPTLAENRITADKEVAVRMFPADASPKSQALAAQVMSRPVTLKLYDLFTLPSKALRVRVEVDNEPPGSTLLLRVDRNPGRAFKLEDRPDPDEVIPLGFPKDQRVYLDLAGAGGSLVMANTVADHVATVDVSDLRGRHELQAALRYADPVKPMETKEARFSFNLVVDDTPPPPDDIRVGPFPKRHVKGKLLPVIVTASDPDSGIERVGVFVGKPTPEGKVPPDAAVVIAERTPLGWVAQVPVPVPPPPPPAPPPPAPPPKKEPFPPFDITVIAENGVGLSTAKVIRIELVEPPGGTIRLLVERGGRPQPGTPVTLRDVAGAEKGVGTTGDGTKGTEKGVVYFRNLPPGVYKMTALKEDSSLGLAGIAAAQIPDPPSDKPVEVVLPLAKRR